VRMGNACAAAPDSDEAWQMNCSEQNWGPMMKDMNSQSTKPSHWEISETGYAALHKACNGKSGDTQRLEFIIALITHGADVNYNSNIDKSTPLMVAASPEKGPPDVHAMYLLMKLSANLDLTLTDKEGRTAQEVVDAADETCEAYKLFDNEPFKVYTKQGDLRDPGNSNDWVIKTMKWEGGQTFTQV